MRDWASAKIRTVGQHLPILNSRRKRSKSSLSALGSSSDRKTPPTPCTQALFAANTPPTARPSVPSQAFASSTAASPTRAAPATSPTRSATTGQPAVILPTLAQTPTTSTTLPQILSPLEIRQRTADLLKIRLISEEAKKIKWDETTEEQAKAVVQEVQRSLEGKLDHTGKMYKTLQYINQYSKIIDVAIQHQPCITALVWAGMRTVIQVCGHSLFVNLYPSGTPGSPNRR